MRLFARPGTESAAPNRAGDSHIYTILPMISENEKYIFFLLPNWTVALSYANRSSLQAPKNPRWRRIGGEGGIRTHGTLARAVVFKTTAFDHSATSPVRAAGAILQL